MEAASPRSSDGFVYIWTHTESGKRYVGKHRGSPDDGYIGSGKAFKAAVKKYGLTSFVRRIIYSGPHYSNAETLIILSLDVCVDPEWYNLSHAASGGTHSAETRAKISAGGKGQKRSKETRHRMRKPKSEQARANIAEANRRKAADPNVAKKISDSLSGKSRDTSYVTDEYRDKMSKAIKGRVMTPEHKAKIAAARKRYWEEKRALDHTAYR